jgi:hypothetical protein
VAHHRNIILKSWTSAQDIVLASRKAGEFLSLPDLFFCFFLFFFCFFRLPRLWLFSPRFSDRTGHLVSRSGLQSSVFIYIYIFFSGFPNFGCLVLDSPIG